jgi:iron(III) transport system substrate-binding protein
MQHLTLRLRASRPALGERIPALLLFLLLLACTRTEPPAQKLTVYCSVQLEWCELVVKTYEAKTGVHIAMTRKSAGETLAQVTAERKNPRGDVWFGGTGDAHLQAAEMGLLEPYRSARVDELHPWAVDPAGQGDHRTTGLYMGALAFGYSSEWLAKKGLPAPTKWVDLTDPRLRGEIQVANPTSSGTAYTLLATWVQLFGEDRAFEFLKALDANVNQYTLSGASAIRAAARGETGIGIVFLHDALTEQASGALIVPVLPEEGTGYETGCISILHGARHLFAAQPFVDWALSTEAQELAEAAHSFQWPSNKSAKAPAHALPLDAVKLIDFDVKRWGKKAERARLLERWEREVHGQSR